MSIKSFSQQIPKWLKMFRGKSILHQPQDVGICYNISTLSGYYNDLTKKITSEYAKVDCNGIPYIYDNYCKKYYTVTIVQYGLGALDMFLTTNKEEYYEVVKIITNWLLLNQNDDGGWSLDNTNGKKMYYSAMIQGECISFLIRSERILRKSFSKEIEKALSILIKFVDNGGCTIEDNKGLLLMEFPDKPFILNGSIFAFWGIYDYCLFYNSKNSGYKELMNQYSKSLEEILSKFDCCFWSNYSIDGKIASPFYHRLHIAQLKVLYEMTGNELYKKYYTKWEKEQTNIVYIFFAIIIKGLQKLFE